MCFVGYFSVGVKGLGQPDLILKPHLLADSTQLNLFVSDLENPFSNYCGEEHNWVICIDFPSGNDCGKDCNWVLCVVLL